MKFNRSLESTAVLKELFQMYKDSGYDWMQSDLVLQAKRSQQTAVTGARSYASFKSLVEKHGENKAKMLRSEKYALQCNGSYLPDVPWHMAHPDFMADEEEELFLVFDSAKVENSKTDEQSHRFQSDMQLSGDDHAAQLSLTCFVIPRPRPALMNQMPDPIGAASSGLPGFTNNALHAGEVRENNPNKNKPKNPNQAKKATSFQQKGQAKIKESGGLLTDAKTWLHKVDEESKKSPAEATVQLCWNNYYMSA
ncbi:unnamed protein product [Symbiodinium necroappetens]|uniref:Uncharacterized protein n=1 Tax=Symbiodinium necroappetens TaxID=1628268 RepID=A0A812V694_9DINO|nr:unnamed protein product [Symbiodinium necroappetens]